MGDIKWEGGETATAQLTSIIPTLVAGPRLLRSRNAPESLDCSEKTGQDAQPQRMLSNVEPSRLQAALPTLHAAQDCAAERRRTIKS